VVRHRGRAFRSAPLSAHVAYLERDGVIRDGEKGRMFGAAEEIEHKGPICADAVAFARRGLNGPVTPEDAAGMTDLKAFTHDLVGRMENDLDTRLD
jgi:type IV secretory pathway VirD2 relaxase